MAHKEEQGKNNNMHLWPFYTLHMLWAKKGKVAEATVAPHPAEWAAKPQAAVAHFVTDTSAIIDFPPGVQN